MSAIGRRGFLRRTAGRHRAVRLSGERLYVGYRAAADDGRLADFVGRLDEEVSGATAVVVTESEWLADPGLRAALARVPGLARLLPAPKGGRSR